MLVQTVVCTVSIGVREECMRVHKNKKCKILMTKKKINNMNLFFHTLVMLVVGCSVNAGGSRGKEHYTLLARSSSRQFC